MCRIYRFFWWLGRFCGWVVVVLSDWRFIFIILIIWLVFCFFIFEGCFVMLFCRFCFRWFVFWWYWGRLWVCRLGLSWICVICFWVFVYMFKCFGCIFFKLRVVGWGLFCCRCCFVGEFWLLFLCFWGLWWRRRGGLFGVVLVMMWGCRKLFFDVWLRVFFYIRGIRVLILWGWCIVFCFWLRIVEDFVGGLDDLELCIYFGFLFWVLIWMVFESYDRVSMVM